MAVDLTGIAIQVSDRLSCPGDNSMFAAYKCDLSAQGSVSFPFWLRSPAEQDCVIWGVFTMSRDTAVYLAKEQVWAEALTMFGAEAQKYVPQDFMSGAWDCATARFAMAAWQRVYGGAGAEAQVVALDPLLFASLLTASPKMQTAAQLLAQNDATMQAMLKGQQAGELVVPPPVPNYGSVFVAAAPPSDCAAGGTTPGGTAPGTTPGTGYLPVAASEDKKWPSWVLPAVIVLGLGAGVGIAYAVTRKKSQAPAMSMGEEASEEDCAECRY